MLRLYSYGQCEYSLVFTAKCAGIGVPDNADFGINELSTRIVNPM